MSACQIVQQPAFPKEIDFASSAGIITGEAACDPGQLQTLCVPVQRNQGVLLFGSLIDIDGNRALIATQVEGVLAATVNTDALPDPPEELSGEIAIYTGGRFLWQAVRNANPSFVFDPVSINTLKAKGITFEGGLLGWWRALDS